MGAEKWKQTFTGLLKKENISKIIILLGFCGIALICLSSFWEPAKTPVKEENSAPVSDYGEELEHKLRAVVCAITGEQDVTVMITLENTGSFQYAADEKDSSGGDEGQQEKNHVILKDSDGAQHALTVTEIQPEIKGVVIVSRYAQNSTVKEKLTQAARTALGISSAKVCVTDSYAAATAN